jgi:hypothetical protein
MKLAEAPNARKPFFMPDKGCWGVPLTHGKVALIDECDVEKVSTRRWQACLYAGRLWYSKATFNGKYKYMHRLILGDTNGLDIDHINRNPLDNRRSNLRVATTSQNCANSRVYKNKLCKFRGVSPKHGKYIARIRKDYKLVNLGLFCTAEDAARAYDSAAKSMFGQFASVNFGEVAV